MKFRLHNTIGGRLLLWFLLLSLLPIITIVLINNYYVSDELSAKSQKNMLNNVKLTANAIDDWVENKFARLEALSKDPVFRSGDKGQIEARLKAVLEITPEAEMIFWAFPDGNAYTSHGLTTNVGDRDYFKPVIGGKRAVSNLLVSKTTQQKIVVVAVPVMGGDGRVIGLVAGTFVPETIYKLIAGTKFGETGYAYMVDQTGMIMAHPDEKYVMNANITKMDSESLNKAGKNMLEKKEGVDEYVYGEDKLVAYAPVKGTGWIVAVTAPTREVYDLTQIMRRINLLVIAAVVIVIIPLALLISRQISRPIVALSQMADVVATGKLQVDIGTNYYGELGILGRSLKTMVNNIYGVISSLQDAIVNLDRAAGEISQAAGNTAQAAEQVSETINQISVGAQETAGSINNISESQKNMVQQFTALANNVKVIAESTQETVRYTQQGEKIIQELASGIKETNANSQLVRTAMERLSEQAKEIRGITDIIASISEQTNLLALNAAIEAARAGDAGRGFAVVAEEVRKLAEASGAQTNEITKLINQITEDITRAVEATMEAARLVDKQSGISAEAQEQFSRIAGGTAKVAQLLQEMENQSKIIEEQVKKINTSMENIAAISQENAASAEEIAASTEEMTAATQTVSINAQHLLGLMEKLKEESRRFQLS